LALMITTLVIFVALSSQVLSQQQAGTLWIAQNFYNPQLNPFSCGFTNTTIGWMCDPDFVLSPDERSSVIEQMVDISQNIRTSTQICPGSRWTVGVALVNGLNVPVNFTAQSYGNLFAKYLVHTWLTGGPCSTGAVVFISATDHVISIAAGQDASQILTPTAISTMITGKTQYLVLNQQYQEALLATLAMIRDLYINPPQNSLTSQIIIAIVLCGLGAAVLIFMVIVKVIEGGRLV